MPNSEYAPNSDVRLITQVYGMSKRVYPGPKIMPIATPTACGIRPVPNTDHTITAGLMGEEVGDPSRDIMVKDWYVTISQAEKHPSITHLTTFARQSSWMKVWDYALDRGSSGTNRALAVLKLVSAPVYGDRRCMLSSCQSPIESTDTMIDHFQGIPGNHPVS